MRDIRGLLEAQDKEALVEFLLAEVQFQPRIIGRIQAVFSDAELDDDALMIKRYRLQQALQDVVSNWEWDLELGIVGEEALSLFFQEVDLAIHHGKTQQAIHLLCIAEDEVVDLDGRGVENGALLDRVYDRLNALEKELQDPQDRSEIFWFILDKYSDRHSLLQMALQLADTSDQWNALRAILEEDSYEKDLLFELLLKVGSQEEQEEFLFRATGSPFMWQRAIEEALSRQNWEQAITYSEMALQHFSYWSELRLLLLDAYIGSGKDEEAQELAFTLTAAGELSYQKLKDLTPASRWAETLEDLCRQIEERDRASAEMLIAEGRLDLLLSQMENFPYLINRHWEIMIDQYRKEMITLMAKRCTTMVDKESPRESFVGLVALLQGLISIGGEKEATASITKLLKRYPTKRMLKQELKKAHLIDG